MDPDELLSLELSLTRSLCVDSFSDFVRCAWPLLEPTRAMLPSIALDALCATLQAVAENRLKRIAIACPPGVSKSLVAAVAFPAWLELRSKGATRIMVGSYSWDFASRDSRRCRDLMTSPWYKSLVGGAWGIREDAARRDDFWLTGGGRRLIVSVGGKALGERCVVQIVDDAISGADTHSPAAKKEATRWIAEVLPSRLEDPENNARVIIGQRLAVDDPIAGVLERGWSYLVLPAVLTEHDVPCELLDDNGALIWRDPRAPGEPLLSLLSLEALDKLKAELGSTAFAAQYGQRPADDSTSQVRRAWWSFAREQNVPESSPRPAGCDTTRPAVLMPEHFTAKVIAADLTFGSLTGDYAVVQCWGAVGGGRYLLEQFRKRCGFEEQLEAIKAMHMRHPTARVCVEKAANGAAVIEQLRKAIPNVLPLKPLGSKAARLSSIAATVESGAAYLPLGWPGLSDFVEELAGATKHDDAQDSAVYALHALSVYDTAAFAMPPTSGWIVSRAPVDPFASSRVCASGFGSSGRSDDDDPLPPSNPYEGRLW